MKVFIIFFLSFTNIVYSQDSDSVKATYIANSGYFIELDNKNILIDGIFNQCIGSFDCPEPELIEKMIFGKYPFEKIDFVLVTHNHPDHVEDSLLVVMLKQRSDFELILPQQVYNSLVKNFDITPFFNRIHNIQLDTAEVTSIEIKETRFDVARSKHADTYVIENLCFIVNDNNFRILHTGDCWPESIVDINKDFFKNIDLAIIPISFGKDRFSAHDSIISSRYTLISHIRKDFFQKLKEIIKIDTATFSTKDVLFEPYEHISYQR